MIFELSFECKKHYQERLAFFIQNALGERLSYSFIYQEEELKFWLDYSNLESQKLEEIIQDLSKHIPQSLFVGEVSSQLLEGVKLPKREMICQKEFMQFCPQCLSLNQNQVCPICQSVIEPIKSELLEEIAQKLLLGEGVEIESKSGVYTLSTQAKDAEIAYCVDIESVLELCCLTQKELSALISFEKPIVRVRVNQENPYQIKKEEIKLALARDLSLFRLFELLREKGIKFLFSANQPQKKFCLQKAKMDYRKYEVVVYENDGVLILDTLDFSQELKERFASMGARDKAFLSTIVLENHLENQNILNFYFSKSDEDCICLYNGQTQWFNAVMKIELPKNSDELFALLLEAEGGESLLKNYTKAYPELLKLQDFSDLPQSFYGLWKIVERVLGFRGGLLEIARDNLYQRGVAIDYKFLGDGLIAQKFDLMSCIRSGMSFKLAGVQEGVIALGYIESFSLLPSKMYLEIRKMVDINGVSLSGDLFANKMIGDFFYKNNRQTPLYRNQQFPLLYRQ